MRMLSTTLLILAGLCLDLPISAQVPPPRVLAESPWNGDWVLSRTRNPKEIREGAAEGYRFHLSADGTIRWEIPTLQEVVEGHTNGEAMTIRRPGAEGQTLAVRVEGPFALRYTVFKKGKPFGEGRMTLVEGARAWVDITQPFGRPDLAHVVIYVRPEAADDL